MSSSDHFKGKSIPEHLKEARKKGAIASAEVHGTEMAGHIGALADSAKETAFYLLILWAILVQLALPFSQICFVLILFSCALVIWKGGKIRAFELG